MPQAHTLRDARQKPGLPAPFLALLLAMVGAAALFLPFLIVDNGFFLYCGDYNSQQIPFYTHVADFIKTGGGTWDWATDLGGSIINSYSFYNLGSPFLWLTLPFPTSWTPYLMVPLFLLKFGAIAATSCLWLTRYAKHPNTAVIASIIFTFGGFNIYNIFFNHMLEPVAIFCFALYSLDAFIHDGKRGFFALAVGLALLDNYFFFTGNVVFLLLYFFVKLALGEYKLSLPAFGTLVFEAVLGVGLGMALALPSLYNLLGNPRVENYASGLNLVIYWHVHQIPNILQSLIVPPDPPYLPNVFPEGAIKWTSMSFFLPIVSISGAVAVMRSRKKSSTRWLLLISFIMALVPFLNSAFYAFNASYYARWYYMPLLIAALAAMQALEDAEIDLHFGVRFTLIATTLYAILGLLPTEQDGIWKLGVAEHAGKFWLTWGTAMLGIGSFAFLLWFHGRRRPGFGKRLLCMVMAFSVFYGAIHIALGKFPQWENDATFKEQQYDGSALVEWPEDVGFYRIDAYNCHDNLGIWMNQSCLQTFNSTVTPSIMEFYPLVGVKRDVSSKPELKHYALRGLLSTRYTVMPIESESSFTGDEFGGLGWHHWQTTGPFAIYENENALPLGFTYDRFIRMDTLEAAPEDDRAPLLVRAIGLDEDQRLTYQHLFAGEVGETYDPVGYEPYTADIANRRAAASYEDWHDASGFGARIYMQAENLVFFGVPYDEGFTATVNGEEVEVLKVSGGLMAVQAPAGDNEIVFAYETPGFASGTRLSLISLGVLVLYLLGVLWYRRRGKALLAPAFARLAARAKPKRSAAEVPGSVYGPADKTDETPSEAATGNTPDNSPENTPENTAENPPENAADKSGKNPNKKGK